MTQHFDLAIVRKVNTITRGNFEVQDINGNILFNAKGFLMHRPKGFLMHRRVLFDAAGKPLVTLQKVRSLHDRWQVFRGEGKDFKDLIFNAKRSSMLQLKTELVVFLANIT
ncbi:hypothetical protein Dsin_013858 [Dipteronia sinensis]|uniref:Uncharacterized protein n=1 Tax=Dipteronia sinensis TaxID=43782 RepID=A0AAE0AL79_9ROSI|nr:hypothetical protein Dsin_013858 [Dipteronia sinensis]